ncbi:NAD-dependent epimerase/dehydratase family protein [Streptacidiphilus monticola]
MAQGDITDLDSLRAVGRAHPVSGILHLAVTLPWEAGNGDAVEAARRGVDGFLNIVRVAGEWGVRRLVAASTIGVYGGVAQAGALSEDLPLPLRHLHAIPDLKKITELLAGQLAAGTGIDIVTARISGTWGPGGHLPDPSSPPRRSPGPRHTAPRRICPAWSTSPTPRTPSTCATSRTPAAPSPSSNSRPSCGTRRTTSARAARPATPRWSRRSPPSSPGSTSNCPPGTPNRPGGWTRRVCARTPGSAPGTTPPLPPPTTSRGCVRATSGRARQSKPGCAECGSRDRTAGGDPSSRICTARPRGRPRPAGPTPSERWCSSSPCPDPERAADQELWAGSEAGLTVRQSGPAAADAKGRGPSP